MPAQLDWYDCNINSLYKAYNRTFWVLLIGIKLYFFGIINSNKIIFNLYY